MILATDNVSGGVPAAVWAAGITGAVSVVALIINHLTQRSTLASTEARDRFRSELDFRVRQLNELYGPLRFLIEQNRRLAAKIREGKDDPESWRLLNNIQAVAENPRDYALAEEILAIDARIENLIIEKAGLIDGSPPASFDLFLGHYRLLVLAMKGKPMATIKPEEYFPRQINEDVNRGYERLSGEVTLMLKDRRARK